MGRTLAELLATVSSRELSFWMAVYRIEPFGEQRADQRAGIIASVGANVHGNKTTVATFFPPHKLSEKKKAKKKRAKAKQSWQDMQGIMIAMTRAMGGTIAKATGP